jgi:hypothetical protein
VRRAEVKLRNEQARAKRTPTQQLEKLDREGWRAAKERARLLDLL